MKKPRSGSLILNAIRCQNIKNRNIDASSKNNTNNNKNNRRSFYELSLSLILLLWCLVLLFYSRLGLSHENEGLIFYPLIYCSIYHVDCSFCFLSITYFLVLGFLANPIFSSCYRSLFWLPKKLEEMKMFSIKKIKKGNKKKPLISLQFSS